MGWMIQGSNPGEGKRFLSSPNLSDWVWGPPSQLFSEYGFPPPAGSDFWGMKLTSDFYLMPRLRMSLAIPLFPLFFFMGWEGKTLCLFLNNVAHYFICWTIRGCMEWIPTFCKWQ